MDMPPRHLSKALKPCICSACREGAWTKIVSGMIVLVALMQIKTATPGAASGSLGCQTAASRADGEGASGCTGEDRPSEKIRISVGLA